MTYDSFEEVPVWQNAVRLAELVDDFVRSKPGQHISNNQLYKVPNFNRLY